MEIHNPIAALRAEEAHRNALQKGDLTLQTVEFTKKLDNRLKALEEKYDFLQEQVAKLVDRKSVVTK